MHIKEQHAGKNSRFADVNQDQDQSHVFNVCPHISHLHVAHRFISYVASLEIPYSY